MDRKLCLDEINVGNKRVLMRMDFDVPITNGIISDFHKINMAIPTIKLVLKAKPKSVVLISHLGKPKGNDERLSLRPIAKVLGKLLNVQVRFLTDSIGEYIEDAISQSPYGSVFLLENLRFYLEENHTDPDQNLKINTLDASSFAKCLSKLGDIYVNDSFITSDRSYASVVGINIPVRVSGLLVKKELKYLNHVIKNYQKPFLAIIGGAKLLNKIPLILNLLNFIDDLIIGGGLAFTFLKHMQDMEIGNSSYNLLGSLEIRKILKKALEMEVKIHLPDDFVTSKNVSYMSHISYTDVETGILNDHMGVDIGPKSITKFKNIIAKAKTILLNGPLGVYENSKFANGTTSCLEEIVNATSRGAYSITVGIDTAYFCKKFNKEKQISHVSPGGKASIKFFEGLQLPGIRILNNYDPKLDEGWKLADILENQDEEVVSESDNTSKSAKDIEEEDGKYICPYREHKCACSEIPENFCDIPNPYPFKTLCAGIPIPLAITAKGCGATEKLCKTMKCPLCCENIKCKKIIEKKCHPCIPKPDLEYRYNLFPERSIVCTTNILPSDHPHNLDFFNCIHCETFFNRNIPTVGNIYCTSKPCYCYKIEYPEDEHSCFSCIPTFGVCCSEPPFTMLN